MKLRPIGLIPTRWHVQQIAAAHPDLTHIDFSGAQLVGGSTMHEVMLQWPDAVVTGLEGFYLEEWNAVKASVNSDEFKRNSGQTS